MSTPRSSHDNMSWMIRNLPKIPTYVAIVVFVVIFIIGQMSYGSFFTLRTVSSLLNDNAYLIILAVAMTVPILTGGIDLSVGAVIALSSVVGCTLANGGTPWPLVVIVMVLTGTLIGALSGTLVRFFDMQPFIATLATMYLAQGIAAMISSEPIVLAQDYGLRNLGAKITLIDGHKNQDLKISVGFLVATVVVLLAYLVMHRTRTGRTIYALGAPAKDSATLMGLPVGRSLSSIYLLSGTMSGVAAVVFVGAVGKGQNILGQGWELNAVAAAVIGGTIITGGAGYVLGSVVGALVFATMNLTIIRDGRINPEATTIITGLLLLLFVIIQRVIVHVAERRRPAGAIGSDQDRVQEGQVEATRA
ncbi:MAG: hypothetical protein L0K65_00765 [Actinomyces sp.]|nr:hypothetical protein [Actinomyces sp.]